MRWPKRPPADWLSVNEAKARVLALVSPLPSEDVPLAQALNRALAAPISAAATLPPWDNSAMDGYAIRGMDIVGALPNHPVELRVVGVACAGIRWVGKVGPGDAVRIMTGGPLPDGADSVVRVEDTDGEEHAGRLWVRSDHDRGRNVRLGGLDMQPGDPLLAVGDTMGPGGMAAAAATGLAVVSVHKRPRVGVLTSGDELRGPERFDDVRAGLGIPDSNGPLLLAAAAECGADAIGLGPVGDNVVAIRERIEEACSLDIDLLVTVGGASMGGTDLFREVLAAMGLTFDFWRVRMRPGSPFSAGRLPLEEGRALPVLGLPGNPASAFVTFHLFARAALRRLGGHRSIGLPPVTAVAGDRMAGGASLTHFPRVRIEAKDGALVAIPTGPQGSGLVKGLVQADGLAVVPEGVDAISAGSPVTVLLLRLPALGDDDHGIEAR
jgi:molybdopterin molybdotransferase